MRQLLIAATTAAAFAVAACGGSTSGSSTAPSQTPATATGTTVRLVDFSLQPGTLSVAAGTTIEVVNAGKSPHNLWIRDSSGQVLARTRTLEPGQQASLSLDLPAGTYTDYCEEPGHESLGMKGTLTIT
jgi:plastocyanin